MFQDFTQLPNIPGLRRVVLLPDDQMAANGQIVGTPSVLELYFPNTRGSLTVSDGGMTAFGKLYSSTVSVTMPRALTDIQDFLTANQYRRYIVYVQDANHRVHRIGGGGDGAVVSISYSVDASLAATTMTLSHSGPVSLPYGAGGLVGIATGPGIIDDYSIEDILGSSTSTVIEQLTMVAVPNHWATANLGVASIPEAYILEHSLGSEKLAVLFFDPDGSENFNIRHEIIDASNIKIYLPTPDDGSTPAWTGEVFLIKRN